MAHQDIQSRLNGQTGDELFEAWQLHMQTELEKAADRFWVEFDRRSRRNSNKKQSHPPRRGYSCNICGKEGGEPGSHWIQFCPDKNKKNEAESDVATRGEGSEPSENYSPKSLPERISTDKEIQNRPRAKSEDDK